MERSVQPRSHKNDYIITMFAIVVIASKAVWPNGKALDYDLEDYQEIPGCEFLSSSTKPSSD